MTKDEQINLLRVALKCALFVVKDYDKGMDHSAVGSVLTGVIERAEFALAASLPPVGTEEKQA